MSKKTKIVLCPDKFKGSLTAKEVCLALEAGLASSGLPYDLFCLPMADGGDGSIEILQSKLNFEKIKINCLDPLGRKIKSHYYAYHDTAYIELASASGLVLLSTEERNPSLTSTFGTGLMIKDALKREYKNIFLFIGGSATNDGGIGIAYALGYNFLSINDKLLEPIGKNLVDIRKIIKTKSFDFEKVSFTIVCDVLNPMHGPNGASYTYAAQKGARQNDIQQLDAGLKNYAFILKSQFEKDISQMQGMGAGGAVSASLVAFFEAEIKNGFQMFSELYKLEHEIKNADLVITGEGKIDATSFQGKVVGSVLSLCQKYSIPCGIIAGVIDEFERSHKATIFEKAIISEARNSKDSMEEAKKYLKKIGKEIGVFLKTSFS